MIHCNFCGAPQEGPNEAALLVTGTFDDDGLHHHSVQAAICDSCIARAAQQIEEKRGMRAALVEGLRMACIGSCSCCTKTPSPSAHDKTCKYRIINEAAEFIERCKDNVA